MSARRSQTRFQLLMARQCVFSALAALAFVASAGAEVADVAGSSDAPWSDVAPVRAKSIQAELEERLALLGSVPAQLVSDPEHEDVQSMELLHEIRVSSAQGGGQEGCKGQLGGLLASLAAACAEASPEEHYVFKYYKPKLPQKTCTASSADLFIYGQRLVEALQVPEEEVVEKRLTPDVAKLVQSLYFLRSWLVPPPTTRRYFGPASGMEILRTAQRFRLYPTLLRPLTTRLCTQPPSWGG